MALKSTKSKSSKEKVTLVTGDDSLNPDEEEVVFIGKTFAKFFQSKNYFGEPRRESSSKRYSRADKRAMKAEVTI